MTTAAARYDALYRRGGFHHDIARERVHLVGVVVPLAGWAPGDRIVEIGAGMGHHAEILRTLGFEVTAVERSPTAVAAARQSYPELRIICADVARWSPPHRQRGHVYARGMSFFHYELDRVNVHGVDVPAATARLFAWVEPGGSFVLQMGTNGSGKRPAGRIHMNRPGDYRRLFASLGTVQALTDWQGSSVVDGDWVRQGVLIVTRRA